MATLRTAEEKSAILAHCLELERTGGDILGYLWSQNYLTPRATWFNYQREWLGRKPYQYTDGKPKKKKERTNMSRLVITEEQKAEAVRIAVEGGSPFAYLKGLGAKSPNGAWNNIKLFYKHRHPDIYAKIPTHPTGWKAPKKLELDAGESYEINVKDAMDNLQEAADTFFGQCKDMGLMKNEQKITKPVNYDGFAVTGIKAEYGEFRISCNGYLFFGSNDHDELEMPVEIWKRFALDLPRVMAILGVEL